MKFVNSGINQEYNKYILFALIMKEIKNDD